MKTYLEDLTPILKMNNIIMFPQETIHEVTTQISYCEDHLSRRTVFSHWEHGFHKIKHMLFKKITETSHRYPIFILGKPGSGKTTFLSYIFRHFEFGENTLKIIRYFGTTPRSSCVVEILRSLCEQINLYIDCPHIPHDKCYELQWLSKWLHALLFRFKDLKQHLFIFLDDINVNIPKRSEWDWNQFLDEIPSNVMLIITLNYPDTNSKLDILSKLAKKNILSGNLYEMEEFSQEQSVSELQRVLKLRNRSITQAQLSFVKEMCKEGLTAHELDLIIHQASKWRSFTILDTLKPRESISVNFLSFLKNCYPENMLKHMYAYICNTVYGMTESEICDLMVATEKCSTESAGLNNGFSLSGWAFIRGLLDVVLLERCIEGEIIYKIRCNTMRKSMETYSESCLELNKGHMHNQCVYYLINFLTSGEETDSKEETLDTLNLRWTQSNCDLKSSEVARQSYTMRRVEEMYYQALQSKDFHQLKLVTAFSFDFLLLAVQSVSISYANDLVETIRHQALDWDVEVVSSMLKKATPILSKNALQLAPEIISWFRPLSENPPNKFEGLVTQAMQWCDGYSHPLLVPLTSWLSKPNDEEIASWSYEGNCLFAMPSPCGQKYILINTEGRGEIWDCRHLTTITSLQGHKTTICCARFTSNGRYLLTGSDDTSIIVWETSYWKPVNRIWEHIAAVTCLTTAKDGTLVISGSEDSRVIACSIPDGEIITKLDHHRGPITCIDVNESHEILAAGSLDKTVSLWSLDTFTLLNTITLSCAVKHVLISHDNIFLIVGGHDCNIYIQSMATGSDVHVIRKHQSQVTSMDLSQDNQRLAVGCCDGKIYIFDIKTTALIKSIQMKHSRVCSLKVIQEDTALFCSCPGWIQVFDFVPEPILNKTYAKDGKKQAQVNHVRIVTCVAIAKDGTLAVSGSLDCLLKVWQLTTNELHLTLEGHGGPVSCVSFAPNGLFVVSGSEDTTARLWRLTLEVTVLAFKGHTSPVTSVAVLSDNKRVITGDVKSNIIVWQADTCTSLLSCIGPTASLMVSFDAKYAVCGGNDRTVVIWSLLNPDTFSKVTHVDDITCFIITSDSQYVVTGSKDGSLKVWNIDGGKLSQVLVGHEDQVTCVDSPYYNQTIVISGSMDNNVIVWDTQTGTDLHVLKGHLGKVTSIQITADGSTAVSGSVDGYIIVWNVKQGLMMNLLSVYNPVQSLAVSYEASRIIVQLKDSRYLPILCLHNTPAQDIRELAKKAEIEALLKKIQKADLMDTSRSTGKKAKRGLLKKEVSLNTYTWQKRYGRISKSVHPQTMIPSSSFENIQSEEGFSDPLKKKIENQEEHFKNLKELWDSKEKLNRRNKFARNAANWKSFDASKLASKTEIRRSALSPPLSPKILSQFEIPWKFHANLHHQDTKENESITYTKFCKEKMATNVYVNSKVCTIL